MENTMIQEINENEAYRICVEWEAGSKENNGLYITENSDGTYSGIDNTTLNCWAEDFKTKAEALKWLKGEK